MTFSESQDVEYNVTKSESPNATQHIDTSIHSSQKQNSIFSLTLDEIQFKSGKNFGSMNMDEFLANLWNAGENPPQLNQREQPNYRVVENRPEMDPQDTFAIPTPLCKKTVDEIWSEIHKNEPEFQRHDIIDINDDQMGPTHERQQTYGEITLEDFLVKAGIVRESSSKCFHSRIVTSTHSNVSYTDNDGSFAFGQPISSQPVDMSGNGYGPSYPFYSHSNHSYGGESSNGTFGSGSMSENLIHSNATKKRIIDGPPEIVIERRQRRMIKNRESAARSRARKQAYTVELELELNHLKDENEKLTKLKDEFEKMYKLEVLKTKQWMTTPKKSRKEKRIRKTISMSW